VQQYSKPYNRVKWLLAFVLCNNKHGLNATGSFVTASKCLKVSHACRCSKRVSGPCNGRVTSVMEGLLQGQLPSTQHVPG
jgi:hypothetical protein